MDYLWGDKQWSCTIDYIHVLVRWGVHESVMPWNHFLHYWPFVMGIHRSQTVPNVELWRFLWCQHKQIIDQTLDLPVIWDALTRMWRRRFTVMTLGSVCIIHRPVSGDHLWHGWVIISIILCRMCLFVHALTSSAKYPYRTWMSNFPLLFYLTLNVRGPNYLGLTRSISWLLVPWPLASPWHQHQWC